MPIWGLWSKDFGLEVLQREKWERRRDLSNVLLRATTEHDPPYASRSETSLQDLPRGLLIKNDSVKYVRLGMFYGEIWESLQYTTNFSYWMVTVNQMRHTIFHLFIDTICWWKVGCKECKRNLGWNGIFYFFLFCFRIILSDCRICS